VCVYVCVWNVVVGSNPRLKCGGGGVNCIMV